MQKVTALHLRYPILGCIQLQLGGIVRDNDSGAIGEVVKLSSGGTQDISVWIDWTYDSATMPVRSELHVYAEAICAVEKENG